MWRKINLNAPNESPTRRIIDLKKGDRVYRFSCAVDDGSKVDIKHFAPSIILVEGICANNTGVVDADVKLPKGILMASICGSQLV